jgi:hypothetical protein
VAYKSLDGKEINRGLYLDLSKAFDLVVHDILLRKWEGWEYKGWH